MSELFLHLTWIPDTSKLPLRGELAPIHAFNVIFLGVDLAFE
jgi:hypothetical protein